MTGRNDATDGERDDDSPNEQGEAFPAKPAAPPGDHTKSRVKQRRADAVSRDKLGRWHPGHSR